MRHDFDMQNSIQNGIQNEDSSQAEETLQLVAQLPPPNGLEDRVHLHLERSLERELTASPQRGFWGLWLPRHRLQFAGAAVLVLAFAGSTWSVRHGKSGSTPGSTPVAQPGPQAIQPGPAFGSAGAERHPSTLKPIQVPPAAPKKKPSASRLAAKHTPKSAAAAEQDSLKTPATP